MLETFAISDHTTVLNIGNKRNFESDRTSVWIPWHSLLFLNVDFLVFESAELLVGYRDRTRFSGLRSAPHDLIGAVWSC